MGAFFIACVETVYSVTLWSAPEGARLLPPENDKLQEANTLPNNIILPPYLRVSEEVTVTKDE